MTAFAPMEQNAKCASAESGNVQKFSFASLLTAMQAQDTALILLNQPIHDKALFFRLWAAGKLTRS